MLLKVESAQPEKQLFIEMTSSITAGNVLPMVEEPRYADFARRLKEAMTCKELTVTDVKSELKITYEMARRYTLGIAMPRDERMRKLADFVGRTAAYLQFGDEVPARHSPAEAPAPAGQAGGAIAETSARDGLELGVADKFSPDAAAFSGVISGATAHSAAPKSVPQVVGGYRVRPAEIESIHASINALSDKGALNKEAIAALTALLQLLEAKNN